ncbi:DUF6007 family protein [Lentibacillus halophilus]|uniref:DUF6007 family protein n=1 Tax=Lentibacillus halophilus TaxID=295065 RepID=A0ABN0ZAU6_9BACI
MDDNLKGIFDKMEILDLIFIIPMFLLFSYLPSYNIWSILFNVIIAIFFAFGLAMTFHTLFDFVNKKNSN